MRTLDPNPQPPTPTPGANPSARTPHRSARRPALPAVPPCPPCGVSPPCTGPSRNGPLGKRSHRPHHITSPRRKEAARLNGASFVIPTRRPPTSASTHAAKIR
ncbi:hypothetical protein GCM10022248_66100 [Nonomuraea soli]